MKVILAVSRQEIVTFVYMAAELISIKKMDAR
jgi:hypothetical protein